MLTALASFFLKFFTGSTLSFVSSIVTQLTNEHAAIVTAQTTLTGIEVGAVINAEIARQNAQAGLISAMMAHPIWWIGWALFVLPAGLYVALIHLKSILCPFWGSACAWNILEVPAKLEAWDNYVVLSFFGLAAAGPIVTALASKITLPK
jgi:hypothetical protein